MAITLDITPVTGIAVEPWRPILGSLRRGDKTAIELFLCCIHSWPNAILQTAKDLRQRML
jgi:hypothetical protein